MSWQDMISNNLIGTGAVSKAAICGSDGSVWAKSDNFNVSFLRHSIEIIFQCFSQVPQSFQTHQKHFPTQERHWHQGFISKAKNTSSSKQTTNELLAKRQPMGSLFIKQFKVSLFYTYFHVQYINHLHILAFIVAIYEGGISPGNCSLATAKLGDYLKSTGY